jgi:hypothetical protein
MPDEYKYWIEKVLLDHSKDNPLLYWTSNRYRWPHLTRFALDIFGIPAMSSEAEQIFSLVGLMVMSRHNRLLAKIIGAAQYIKLWEHNILSISRSLAGL